MGRSYHFECSRCGYRATVSGRADRGLNLAVQTIVCRDCRKLSDAVTRFKIPDESGLKLSNLGLRQREFQGLRFTVPPSFDEAVNRLPYQGVKRFRWLKFKLQCPVSRIHSVEPWNAPNKCPRCGLHMESNALPYRIWE
jgi:hypothetical protein